jgi:hypothetical protein
MGGRRGHRRSAGGRLKIKWKLAAADFNGDAKRQTQGRIGRIAYAPARS